MQENLSNPSLEFKGNAKAYFPIWLYCVALQFLTLSLFRPWAKTEKRRFFWQNTFFKQEPFLYHGTGKELFRGYITFLIGAALFAFIAFQISSWELDGKLLGLYRAVPGLHRVSSFIFGLPGFYLLLSLLKVKSMRYVATRTSYSGYYFSVEKIEKQVFFETLKLVFLFPLTLGLYYPYYKFKVARLVMNNLKFGGKNFSYEGNFKVEFRLFIRNIIFTFFTFGMHYFWYRADILNYRSRNMRWRELNLNLTLSGGSYFLLSLFSWVATLLSFGLLTPYVSVVRAKYFCERSAFQGNFSIEGLDERYQRKATLGATSEFALEHMQGEDFDLGVFFDF